MLPSYPKIQGPLAPEAPTRGIFHCDAVSLFFTPAVPLSRKRRVPAKNLTFKRNNSQIDFWPVLRFPNLVHQTINH
jgi:hypothetical protein